MSSYPPAEDGTVPSYDNEKGYSEEKRPSVIEPTPEYDVQQASGHELHRSLKSRHMQMIAIGMPTSVLAGT
jgi:amino acid permease